MATKAKSEKKLSKGGIIGIIIAIITALCVGGWALHFYFNSTKNVSQNGATVVSGASGNVNSPVIINSPGSTVSNIGNK